MNILQVQMFAVSPWNVTMNATHKSEWTVEHASDATVCCSPHMYVINNTDPLPPLSRLSIISIVIYRFTSMDVLLYLIVVSIELSSLGFYKQYVGCSVK
jgi:hypothetical protein